MSIVCMAALVAWASFLGGWLLWTIVLIILKIKHPPVYYWRRLWTGEDAYWGGSLIIFILTFIPLP